VGNVYPHKNAEMLVHAFTQFVKDPHYRSCKLCFVGREDYFYKNLKQKVSKLHMDDHIRFLGAVDDTKLASLYTEAEALVFPSQMEGFGLPALETLAYNCPVIVSDIPIFREILGDVPLFVPLNNEQAWIEALKTVSTWQKKEKSIKEKNIQTLLSRYSWKTMAAQTVKLYADCTRL